MTTSLNPDGLPVYVGDVVIRTPGLTGEAELQEPVAPDSRGPTDGTEAFFAALARVDMQEVHTVRLSNLEELDATLSESRGAAPGTESIELEVPAPTEDYAQVLLYIAEDGSASWHFPEEGQTPIDSQNRGQGSQIFRIPRALVTPPPGDTTDRGILDSIGEKILKFLVFPLIDPILGEVADYFAGKWEKKHRRSLLRSFSIDNYAKEKVPAVSQADWAGIGDNAALLFLHGTFAQSHNAFDRMNGNAFGALASLYEGRVLAYDHFTVSKTPAENASDLAALLPHDVNLTLDIIAHSRGGLVARELVERAKKNGLPDGVRIRSVIMVATPNAGTALAQKKNLKAWLDRITNLVQLVPDSPVTEVLSMVLTVLKQLALGAFGGLDGLRAMDPDGDYLTKLNVDQSRQAPYYAIAANFEPKPGAPMFSVLRDHGVDLLFRNIENDAVVPTAGANTVKSLPDFVADSLILKKSRGVNHSTYFEQAEVADRLLTWLTDVSAAPKAGSGNPNQ